MKGARGLASGMLVLAAICAVPAVSAAQDSDSPAETTTTTAPDPSVPADPSPPIDPAEQDVNPARDPAASQDQAAPEQVSAAQTPGVGSGPGSPGPAHASASAKVTMGDFFFSPETVTVAVGDIVTWRNTGNEPHTATADDGSFDTGNVVAGQNASRVLTSPGTFSYICTIHPNMKGTVRVLSGGSGGGGSAGSSSTGSSQSEAAAVASPDAAGTSTSLPATGMATGALALIGLVLLACGAILRRAGDETDRPSRS